MLVSVKWLREYVDINKDVKEFADEMTMTGTKMETVEYLGEDIKKVVVGKILSIEKHPDADKLIVTQVDVGQEEPVQIVTGAKNVNEGDYIPVALHGSTLPGGVKIKKGKLRGIASNGMMCSSEELGIDEKYIEDYKKDGIYILDFEKEYTTGMEATEVLGVNDAIIDFELTANRPDCRCMLGIAREAAITLGQKIKYPEINIKAEVKEPVNFEVNIENEDLCKRFLARRVKDVKIEKSPYWLQRRLVESGVRPINNIVDITNYVMLETGQPMHAYDVKEVANNKIVVKNAAEGDVFVTLDEQERKLDSDMLMITNGEKYIGIAGVMGGMDSGVKDDTTEIIFEAASFDSANIRKTSKRLGLRSEASGRFEKGVSIENAQLAIDRAVQLVEMLNAGKVVEEIVDVYPNPVERQKVTVNPVKIKKVLGVDISMEQFVKILEDLEFKCNLKSEEELELEVPAFRLDIVENADILEEIARIYGFENIPSEQMKGNTTAGIKTERQLFTDLLKSTAVSAGLYETLTYSFVSPKGLDKINAPQDSKLREYVKLLNPLGEDTSIMRTTLIPNMMNVLGTNISHYNEEAAMFECGHIFEPTNMAGEEKRRMCIGMYGKDEDFFTLKGVIEKIFERVGLKEYKYNRESTNPTFHPGRCAIIDVKGKVLATLGEIHPHVLENYSIKNRIYIAEIDLDMLYELSDRTIIYSPLPKYPAITRDIALIVSDDVLVGDIEEIIEDNAGKYVESYKLFDVYKGAQVGIGKKSVAYTITYRSMEGTLTDDDIVKNHKKILSELSDKLGAKLRDN